MSLTVDIHKKFPGFSLDVSFTAGDGRIGILGASGCGKSMTLKCIAGIEKPDSGKIVIDGRTVFDSGAKINLEARKRNAGYLFQNYALFPTMTVEQNIAIATRGIPATERRKVIEESLRKMRLENCGKRYPAGLSGGQQQRVALARMLASKPDIIMLDEPFAALDSYLRTAMEEELMETLSPFPGTILFVSHNRDEVYRICDKLIILDNGQLVGEGEKQKIFADPQTLAAAALTGCKNIAPFEQISINKISIPSWGLCLETARPVPEGYTHAGIRAHHIRPAKESDTCNCSDFNTEPFVRSPFTVSRYIRALSDIPLSKLRWDVEAGQLENTDKKGPEQHTLCIPAEHLLFLK